MTASRYRNTLLLTSIFATLSIGAAGCSNSDDERAASISATPTVAERAQTAGNDATQAMSDTWITSKVKSVLLADSDAKGLDTNVETQNGVVTLRGEYASQAEVDHVKQLAADVEGVRRVNASGLTVASR